MLTKEKLKKDIKKKYDLYFYISNRGGRKSSAGQELFIDTALNTGKPFIILRNKVTHKISDRTLSKYVRELYESRGYYFETVTSDKARNMVELYAVKNDDKILIAYGMFVSCAEAYKSNYFDGWEKVSAVLWEECVENKRILQDLSADNIKAMSKQFENVLSIMSTVTREHKAPLIAFGNDIPENLINSVTANLNILERLSEGEIVDTCIINQEKYKFLFDYFRVKDKPMLWLDYRSKDVCQEDISDKIICQIKTDYNVYTMYEKDTHYYISQELFSSSREIIDTYEKFLSYYFNIHEYVEPYILCSIFGKENPIIKKYIKNYNFEPIYYKKAELIDFSAMRQKSYPEITLEELSILRLIYKNIVTYSNIAIKFISNELIIKFFKLI